MEGKGLMVWGKAPLRKLEKEDASKSFILCDLILSEEPPIPSASLISSHVNNQRC